MYTLDRIMGKIRFLKLLYEKRDVVRRLLESENFKFLEHVPPGHYLTPIPDLTDIRSRSGAIFDGSARELPGIDVNEDLQIDLLTKFSNYYGEIPFPDNKTEKFRYFFNNNWYGYGDAVVLYSFLRHFKPKRVIEVGSGFSSAEILDINERFLNSEAELLFIEPAPDRLFGLLTEEDKVKFRVVMEPVQGVSCDTFDSLGENDMLFIDSSHVAKIGSDVLHIVSNILPRLRRGVIIHFHDVLWPFEYPQAWLEGGAALNEAYFLRAFLQYNSAFEILYFNSFMAIHHADEVRRMMPAALKAPPQAGMPGNSSLWIRKVR